MFRLVKLAVYGLIGYAAYEFLRGAIDGPAPRQQDDGGDAGQGEQQSQGGRKSRSRRSTAADAGTGASGLLGGSDSPKGQTVQAHDADGATITERVGRGVIQQ